jgi:hypothetical protein
LLPQPHSLQLPHLATAFGHRQQQQRRRQHRPLWQRPALLRVRHRRSRTRRPTARAPTALPASCRLPLQPHIPL